MCLVSVGRFADPIVGAKSWLAVARIDEPVEMSVPVEDQQSRRNGEDHNVD